MTAIEPPPSLRAALLNPAGRPHMGAVIVTHGVAKGGILRERTEVPPHALADRFQSVEARGP